MTAFLEPREGVLIARKGEEIVCPKCGDLLARLIGDLRFEHTLYSSPVRKALVAGRADRQSVLLFAPSHRGVLIGFRCRCGGDALLNESGAGGYYLEHVGPRLHLRSGSWVGWRGLGE